MIVKMLLSFSLVEVADEHARRQQQSAFLFAVAQRHTGIAREQRRTEPSVLVGLNGDLFCSPRFTMIFAAIQNRGRHEA